MIQITIGPVAIHFGIVGLFLINFFMAGMAWKEWDREIKWKQYGATVSMAMFGVVAFVLSYVLLALRWTWRKQERYLQLGFFIKFYLTRKYHNWPEENLIYANRLATEKYTTSKLRDRIFRKAMRLVNKRNNYTYTPKPTAEF